MTELDIHIRKLLAVLDVEMDAARQELDERRATETGIIGGLAKDDTFPHPVYGFLHTYTKSKSVKFDSGMHKHVQGVPVSATPPTITVKGVKVI